MRRIISHAVFAGIILTTFLLLNCAKVIPPPGGPVDKTGAKIVSTTPQKGATGVLPSSRISLEFSESINRKTAEEAIFFTPRFAEKPEFKWKGKTLHIIPVDLLEDSTTYIINIGAGVKDLRGNLMDRSYVLAFSTGPAIDHGRIFGTVVRDGKPAGGITIGLYDFPKPDSTTIFDSIYPPYMTQSGKDGKYALEYLPGGEYFLLAFSDDNANQRFNLSREQFGVTDRLIRLTPGQPLSGINFSLTSIDTSRVSILLATYTPDKLVKVTFSRKVPVEKIVNNLNEITLIPADSGESILSPQVILKKTAVTDNTFTFYFGVINPGEYRLRMSNKIFKTPEDSIGFIESAVSEIAEIEDNRPPRIEYMSHYNQLLFAEDNEIIFHFSEPVDTNILPESLLVITDGYDRRYDYNLEWPDVVSLKSVVSRLESGLEYHLDFNRPLIKDLSGNPAGDSTWRYRFRTYNIDSLGTVTGTASIGPAIDTSGSLMLVFSPVKGKSRFERRISGKTFETILPPGKYLLFGYMDDNKNDREDAGSLFPFVFSESRAAYPDTIRVRARFETAGIDFRIK